ncbi:MAG: DUF433 domain-containing protein [Emticicia sp.]|uniref:DUF433 domain-containing protein n=1 Tax=Emticicia sp. TaxID=1930953 RepID=UPI003BA4B9A4
MKYPLIVSDVDILGGKPCIKGTRISVQLILEWIASGATIQDIVSKYPHLSVESIQQAILYASDAMKNEIIIEVQHSNAA